MVMDRVELENLLEYFRNLPSETEWLEFKEAKRQYSVDKLGQYFSAISNEANLKNQQYGWIIFGIKDTTKEIVGTAFKQTRSELENLKHEIAQQINNNLTFTEIHEFIHPEGRVIMFQVPQHLEVYQCHGKVTFTEEMVSH